MTAPAEQFDVASLVLDHLNVAIAKHGLTEIRPQTDASTLVYFIGRDDRFRRVGISVREARSAHEQGLLADLVEQHVDLTMRQPEIAMTV